MEIRVAESAGFCFGVSRAVDTVYRLLEENPGKKIYTYGPIVHNDQVVNDLKSKGVEVISGPEELEKLKTGGRQKDAIIIVRAHGISDAEMKTLKEIPGLETVDATCPYVTKIHDIVRKAASEGKGILVAGDPDHPEVRGIRGCGGENVTVISEPDSAKQFKTEPGKKYILVSQTTYNPRKFEELVEIFKKSMYDVSIVNTICNATQRRQSEAAELSRECDVMLVIGGRNSSNTAKLYEICRSECQATYYIQCLDDLSRVAIGNSVRCIGITAGASTPKTIIEEVLNYVRTEFWRYACRGAY